MMREILVVAVLLAAPAYGASPSAEAAIKAAVGRIDTCVGNQDMKCLGELFADDATFGGPENGGKLITGKPAILRTFEKMKGSGTDGVKQVRTVERVRLIGTDRALVDTSVKLSGAKDLGDGVSQAWHAVMLVRLEDGKWLLEDVRSYVVVTGSPPTPVPLGSPVPIEPTKAPEPEKPVDAAEPAKP